MERTVLLAAATWIGGVGAWTVGAGYALAPHIRTYVRSSWRGESVLSMLDEGTGEDDTVDVDVLPAPRAPQELSAPAYVEEPADPDPLPTSSELVRPNDIQSLVASGMLTESQERRLAPIKSLKRTRRSRKVRVASDTRQKYVPLVLGARATTDESILAAASGPKEARREQGEDYYVDPALLREELEREAAAEERRKSFKLKKDMFGQEKLRAEIAAPYKNNLIGIIVVSIGVIAVLFAFFPELLENNVANSIASFPDSL